MTSDRPTAHLLHGRVGSGKTTFARRLAIKRQAVRFTHDEWVVRLFGQQPPIEHFREYYDRVTSLIWDMAAATLQANADVILDYGFWTRESRDDARARVLAANAVPKFYSMDCPVNIARRRTLERSEDPPADSLWIDAAAFDKFEALFEPMLDDEAHESVSVPSFRI